MYRAKKVTAALTALGTLCCAVLLSFQVPTTGAATPSSSTSPLSVTFVSSGEGWALTTSKCGTKACVHLTRTKNEGKSWSDVSIPASLQTWVDADSAISDFPLSQPGVYFANSADGWIYGASSTTANGRPSRPELWSTHNGGLTWSPMSTSSLGMKFEVLTMSSSNSWVYAIGWRTYDTFGLWRVSVASNTWQRVATPILYAAAGGSTMVGALVFQGSGGWLMIGNDRGATGLARMTPNGTWVKWSGPCGPVGDSYAVPVASSSTNLLDVCMIGGFGADVASGTPAYLKMNSQWLFISHDGGVRFSPLREVGVGYTTQWRGGVAGTPASTSQGSIFVEKSVQSGQSSIQHLEISRNEARSWTTVYPVKSTDFASFFGPVSFTSKGLGSVIVLTSPTTSLLLLSSDGGLRWARSNA